MRLRSLLTLLILVWGVHLSIQVEALIERYKQVRWEDSPMYILQNTVDRKFAIYLHADETYNTFKILCRGFGRDMKLLKSLEAYDHSDKAFIENMKSNLYHNQFILMERWLIYDHILFPGISDHNMSMYYLKHIKPRRT